jgi:hypothetical protein
MSTERDVNRIVRSWLGEGVSALPDRVLDTVLDQLPATPQRRAPWPARRFGEMNTFTKFAVAAAAVALVAFVGLRLLPGEGGVGSQSSPSASPAPSPTASPSPSPSLSQSPALFPSGPLPAGNYTTQPLAGPGGMCVGQAGCIEAGAEDDSIRVTVTVPDGWAGFDGRSITPSVESYLPPDGASLLFGRGGWLYTVSEVCGGSGPDAPTGPTIPTGTTVDEFVTALVDHPDLDVTSPVDVTLSGFSGKYLELRAPANITTDELGPDPSGCNYYFVWEPGVYAQGPNALWRIWVLDVDGIRVVVRTDSFPGTSPQVQAQLQTIVDSIQIEP